jgi:hypothetical protein
VPKLADLAAVVVVGDLPGPVVEFQLLERCERLVAAFLEREAAGILLGEPVVAVAGEERPGDEPDGSDGEQRAEHERGGQYLGLLGQLAVPHCESLLLADVRPEGDERAEEEHEA